MQHISDKLESLCKEHTCLKIENGSIPLVFYFGHTTLQDGSISLRCNYSPNDTSDTPDNFWENNLIQGPSGEDLLGVLANTLGKELYGYPNIESMLEELFKNSYYFDC